VQKIKTGAEAGHPQNLEKNNNIQQILIKCLKISHTSFTNACYSICVRGKKGRNPSFAAILLISIIGK
jgi:hypothetical protein